jgi:protein-disulfide isomerase
LSLALCVIGLLVSEYMFLRTLWLIADVAPQAVDLCSAVFGGSCDATLKAAPALFGIPLSGWGVVFFGTLILLLVIAWALAGSFARRAAYLCFAVTLPAALTAVWLASLFVFGQAPWCPLCSVSHVLTWALVPTFWLLARASPPATQRLGVRDLAGFGGTAVAALAIALLVGRQVTAQEAAHSPARALMEYTTTPAQEIPVGADDARLGPADAPVRLVVFSDFQCPGCREFALSLRRLADTFRDRLAIYFKHYPLSTDCHPGLPVDLHPGSCQAAGAAEAARRQGKFWEFHDYLFEAGDAGEPQLQEAARVVGLDLERFTADRSSDEVRRKAAADLELGSRLGVDGTPSVFVNGRRVRDLRLAAMGLVINHAADMP